ncbi:hypothetical protein B0O99DRAFT_668643 [Bisporella sp. PMI_857]|nr:hypothetical protein B0O99DRAFT_668643 [Bisporella sp. PMI_857]
MILESHYPDGFIYTQTVDRQPCENTNFIDTNLNRNYPLSWELPTDAVSDDPCEPNYNHHGETPADTIEVVKLMSSANPTKAVNSHGIKSFIDFHSNGQVLHPYSDRLTPPPANIEAQLRLIHRTSEVIAGVNDKLFPTWDSCTWAEGLPFMGTALDWMTQSVGLGYAWTIELRDHFDVEFPAEYTLISCVEQWEGIKYMLSNA